MIKKIFLQHIFEHKICKYKEFTESLQMMTLHQVLSC